MDGGHSSEEPRVLTGPVFIAILALPILFVWLLLRRGYSRDLRIGGFLYAFSPAVLTLIVAVATGEVP